MFGRARCSNVSGTGALTGASSASDITTHTTFELGADEGRHCYCNVTGYKDINGNLQSLSSLWVLDDNIWDCTSMCAGECSRDMRDPETSPLLLRTAVLDSVGAYCELRHIDITFNENTNDTVTYMPSVNPKTCLYGEDCVVLPPVVGANVGRLPARTGYKFVEWNTQSNGTGSGFVYVTHNRIQEADLSGVFDLPGEPENVTLYAQWTPISYTIIYNNMDDATNYDNAPTSYTSSVGATINGTPTRNGYFFDGWCTDAELENCAYTQTIGRTVPQLFNSNRW